jgi:hypothetical protein
MWPKSGQGSAGRNEVAPPHAVDAIVRGLVGKGRLLDPRDELDDQRSARRIDAEHATDLAARQRDRAEGDVTHRLLDDLGREVSGHRRRQAGSPVRDKCGSNDDLAPMAAP